MIPKVIAIVYLIALLGVGFMYRRGVKTRLDYFVAGRKLTPLILGLSFATAVTGVWSYIGAPGSGYAYGVPEFASFAAWIPGVAIVAFIWAPRVRAKAAELQVTSFTGFIRDAHKGGYPLTVLISIITMAAYVLTFVAALKGLGVMFGPVLGVSYIPALLICGTIIIVYSLMGGLRAVVLTDIAGLAFMCIAFGTVVWLILSQGGIGAVATRINEFNPELLHPPTGAPYGATMAGIWISFLVMYVFYQALPHYWHYYISLGETTKKGAAIFTLVAVVSVCMVPFFIFAGMAGHVLLPGVLEDPDTVMPMIFQTYANPVVFGLFSIGVFTAIMTTFDGSLLATTACVDEMFLPLYNRHNQTEVQKLKWGRIIMVVLWAVAVIWATTSPPALMVKLLVLGWVGLSAVIAGPTLCYFIKAGTKWGAFFAILISLIVLVVLSVGGLLGWIEQAFVALGVSIAVYYIASAIERKVSPAS